MTSVAHGLIDWLQSQQKICSTLPSFDSDIKYVGAICAPDNAFGRTAENAVSSAVRHLKASESIQAKSAQPIAGISYMNDDSILSTCEIRNAHGGLDTWPNPQERRQFAW